MQEICIVLYVILLFVVSNRKKTSNDVDFFTAGKNSSWPAVAFGMVGATISGISLVSVPGMVIVPLWRGAYGCVEGCKVAYGKG